MSTTPSDLSPAHFSAMQQIFTMADDYCLLPRPRDPPCVVLFVFSVASMWLFLKKLSWHYRLLIACPVFALMHIVLRHVDPVVVFCLLVLPAIPFALIMVISSAVKSFTAGLRSSDVEQAAASTVGEGEKEPVASL